MSQVAGNNVGFNAGWNLGEDGWKSGMDRNFVLAEALVQANVASRTLTTPPSSPAHTDRYLVPDAGATGAWSSHAKALAVWDGINAAWVYETPLEGWSLYVVDEDKWWVYNGSTWVVDRMRESGESVRTAAISGGTLTIDTKLGACFDVLLNANVTTFALTNPAASPDVTRVRLRVRQDATGGRTFALPGAVKTVGGAGYVPTAAANAIDELELTTWDAGTSWYLKVWQAFA